MIILQSDITAKIRTAIDDIVPEASDSFTDDTDAELWQAVQHAVEGLLQELPVAMLEPVTMIPSEGANLDQTEEEAGCGYITLADDFLRFVALKLTTWLSPVYTLIEPGSDDEIRQRGSWGRGTPDKPKAMITHDAEGSEILRYWTAGQVYDSERQGYIYDHTVDILNYIPVPKVEYPETPDPTPTPTPPEQAEETPEETRGVNETTRDAAGDTPPGITEPQIDCALKEIAEKAVIYQAAAIFFEGKKEPDTADKFRNI